MSNAANVNGQGLVGTTITMPRVGAWHAEIELDTETAPTGSVTIASDGIEFNGTVVRSGVFASMSKARVVGGNGGLSKDIGARHYIGGTVTVGSVVRDLLRDCGETLSLTSDPNTLTHGLAKWERSQGRASHSLVAVLDAVGASWRVLRDGTVWIGVDTWPAATLKHDVLDEDWAQGLICLASDAPELEPGTTLDGQRIETVIHRIADRVLRTEASTVSPSSSLNRFLGGIRRQVDFAKLYPCKVATQHNDGSLSLVPDDDKMRGYGVGKVRPRHGLPGFKVVVKPGARVMLGFDAGDPARPYASLWDAEGASAVDHIAFNDGMQSVTRVGDLVQSGGTGTIVTLTPVAAILPAPLAPAVGIAMPYFISFSSIPPTPLSASPLYGSVMTGCEKLKS